MVPLLEPVSPAVKQGRRLTVGCSSFCRHVLGRYCELSPAQGVTNRAVNETDLV